MSTHKRKLMVSQSNIQTASCLLETKKDHVSSKILTQHAKKPHHRAWEHHSENPSSQSSRNHQQPQYVKQSSVMLKSEFLMLVVGSVLSVHS